MTLEHLMPLSTRTKEAIKIGLAFVIAYDIALWMDWEKPEWAGMAVAICSLATAGQSVNKGVMRMCGTLVGFTATMVFIALFPQARWGFMAVVSVWVGISQYMWMGKNISTFLRSAASCA